MPDVLAQATVVVGGQIDPNIGVEVARSFDKVDDAMDDAVAALARVQSAVDEARATSTRAFGELGESSNLARDGFGDLSTAASSVGSGLVATGLITDATATKFTAVADTLGGVEGAFTAVKGASSLAGSAFTAMTTNMAKFPPVAKAVALGQRAINVAMKANPIGLVVTAIGLLVAGLVLAYKRSETFRNIVNGAFEKVKTVATPIIDGLVSGFNKFKDAIKGAWDWVVKLWDKVSSIDVPDWLQSLGGAVGSAVPFFADGGVAPGGWAVVGEQGPELVNLPGGSRVYSNADSRRMVQSGGGGSFVYAPVFNGPTTGAGRLAELDWTRKYGSRFGASSSAAVA